VLSLPVRTSAVQSVGVSRSLRDLRSKSAATVAIPTRHWMHAIGSFGWV